MFLFHKNYCQGKAPGPLRGGEGNHGEATARRVGAADTHDGRAGDGGRGSRAARAGPRCAPLQGSLSTPAGLGQRVRVVAERRLGAAELRELNRIGVNLNQMARAMNAGAAAPAGTREAVEQVSELVARVLAGEAE